MFHKASELSYLEGTTVEVTFQDGIVKQYDIAVLFEKYPKLKALTDRALFVSGKLMGYGIVWTDELDLETETIYKDGTTVRKQEGTSTGMDQSDALKTECGVADPSVSALEHRQKTDVLTFDVDSLVFNAASAIVNRMGYDMEEAVNLLLRRIVETLPIPEQPVPREEAMAILRKTIDRNCEDMYTQPLLLPHGDVYGVELLNCALPAFVTFDKPYFGSLEDIAEFRRAFRKAKVSGLKEMTFFTTHLYGAKHNEQGKGKHEHINTWGYPYYIWWDRLDSVHIWLRYGEKYWRCLRARIVNMKIDTEPDGENAKSYGEQIWGHPNIVEYIKPFHFNRMYVIEKRFNNEKELQEDMEQFHGEVDLKGFLDDVFGDG